MSQLRRWVAKSPVLAPLAALPIRLGLVLRHDATVLRQSARWLRTSREHTNLTYDLTELNQEHLAWWVAAVTGCSADQARDWMREVQEDEQLAEHVRRMRGAAGRRGLSDPGLKLGRRLGWYAVARALRPQHVMETGTDKGLGALVFASALLRNGSGRLTTVDLNPDAGYLISGRYAEVTTQLRSDSLAAIASLTDPVDLTLHDSVRTEAHELQEYDAVARLLSPKGVVLSNHISPALARWSQANGRRFLYFDERPAGHWYPGAGIGASW